LYSPKTNNSTRIYVLILGIVIGLGGMAHGIFEALLGNKPTVDILERIGAFTILPTYLLTGISAIIVSILIIVWTIRFIHKKNGPIIFLLLSILLFFTGGGVAIIAGFLLTWTVSTRINKPLTWWKKVLSENSRKQFARFWLVSLITGFLLLSIGILIWLLFTPPGEIYKITIVDYLCWLFLCLGLLFQIFTIISGFARDIEIQNYEEYFFSEKESNRETHPKNKRNLL
jgi:hypothetical protein